MVPALLAIFVCLLSLALLAAPQISACRPAALQLDASAQPAYQTVYRLKSLHAFFASTANEFDSQESSFLL
jgi:CHASE1-domain containing sensor protein